MIDKVKRNARQRRWNKANPDKVRATMKRWVDRHPERAKLQKRAANKRYYLTHPEEVAERKRAWRLNNPDKVIASVKRVQEKRRKVLEGLVGKPRPECCEICNSKKVLAADHCHASGSYRGWICHTCNLAIGNAKDDPSLLRKMAEYLEAHKTRRRT